VVQDQRGINPHKRSGLLTSRTYKVLSKGVIARKNRPATMHRSQQVVAEYQPDKGGMFDTFESRKIKHSDAKLPCQKKTERGGGPEQGRGNGGGITITRKYGKVQDRVVWSRNTPKGRPSNTSPGGNAFGGQKNSQPRELVQNLKIVARKSAKVMLVGRRNAKTMLKRH